MKAYRVSEVNSYINKSLSTDIILSDISIEGEISNFVHHSSGHMYFNLKDQKGRIKCVMFKSDNRRLEIQLEEGLKIVARGNISVYERDGVYQLYVREAEEYGVGKLYREFEALKKKLEAEGLFAREHKQELPELPRKIGLVTSKTGAVLRDIITVVRRRFPATDLLIYPSLVQGVTAPKTIIKGLKYLDQREDVDLIIFGRGGGSIDELFAFNDEDLARAIFDLRTPSISAVGHEVDTTISDFVADVRAATPSAAAELAVPDLSSYLVDLKNIHIDIEKKTLDRIGDLYRQLRLDERELAYLNPEQRLRNRSQDLDSLMKDIRAGFAAKSSRDRLDLSLLKSELDLLDPRLGLSRGYAILLDQEGRSLRSLDGLRPGQPVDIVLRDGRIRASIDEVFKEEV